MIGEFQLKNLRKLRGRNVWGENGEVRIAELGEKQKNCKEIASKPGKVNLNIKQKQGLHLRQMLGSGHVIIVRNIINIEIVS